MTNIYEYIAANVFRTMFIEFKDIAGFVDSELGPIPKGWEVCELGDYLSVIETGSRPKGGVKEISEGIPSIGAESILGLGRFDYGKTRYVSESFFEGMRRGKLEHLDVLLYKDGGKPGQFEPHVSIFGYSFPFSKMSINEHVYRLRVKKPITQSYLYFWLITPLVMEEMRRRGTGVAIPGLNSTSVKELPLLVPDEAAVLRFEKIGGPIIEKVLLDALPFS